MKRGFTPTLRSLLFAGLALGVLYAASGAVYLMLELGPSSVALRRSTGAVMAVFTELQEREGPLEESVMAIHSMAESGEPPSRARIDAVRSALEPSMPGETILHYGILPDTLLEVAARHSRESYELRHALLNQLALQELGRTEESRRYLATVDSLHLSVRRSDAETHRLAFEFLLEQEGQVARAADVAGRVVTIWLIVTILLIPGVLLLVRNRVGIPLRHLQHGIERISRGELDARVEIRHDDEIGALGRHFNTMAAALEERVREQGRLAAAGQLLAGVAHEVMNPLMAILSNAREQLDRRGGPPDPEDPFETIRRQADRATRMVRGLVTLVRPSHGVSVGSTPADPVVTEALSLVSYQFEVDEIDVSTDLDGEAAVVRCDRSLLLQASVNVLSSAIDALGSQPPPRRLHVSSELDGTRYRIVVADGTPRDVPRASAALERPFAETAGGPAADLRLYIAGQAVGGAGGAMWVEERPGPLPFAVVIELPAETAPGAEPGGVGSEEGSSTPASAAAAPKEGEDGLRGATVLVVDDEAAIRRPICRYLRRVGADVREAGDGVEAMERIREEEPDVILADLRMPRMDGVGLYAEIRRTRPALTERYVVLSGDVTKLRESFDAEDSPERVLVKPVDLVELARVLGEVVARAGRPDAVAEE